LSSINPTLAFMSPDRAVNSNGESTDGADFSIPREVPDTPLYMQGKSHNRSDLLQSPSLFR
jgi:hypothetical protein